MMEDYLNGNVKEIIEPMISALLTAQPDDPKFFMLNWLKHLYSLDYVIINKEKEELENLKLEIKVLKEKQKEQKEQKEAVLKKANSEVSKKVSENEVDNKSEESKNTSENNKGNLNDKNNEKKSNSESSESFSQISENNQLKKSTGENNCCACDNYVSCTRFTLDFDKISEFTLPIEGENRGVTLLNNNYYLTIVIKNSKGSVDDIYI